MRVLHIINSLHSGGAQSVLVDLLTHWGDPADAQMVISLVPGSAHEARLRGAGVVCEHVGVRIGPWQAVNIPRLLQLARRFKPDVAQTWLYHASLFGSVAVRAVSRAPIVWGLHHTLGDPSSLRRMTWVVVRLLATMSRRLPAAIVCCSRSTLQTHRQHGFAESRLAVVENGVDTGEFRPDPHAREAVREELGVDPETPLIGMFARFHPQKDHSTMLAAAGILHEVMPDVHFVLAGEGMEAANTWLRKQLAESGLSERFHCLGDRTDMSRMNAAMDLVTLSSSHGEALPRSLAEAMACGVPCVSTAVGDSQALIGDSGLVVEPGRPQELAAAWQHLISLPKAERAQLGVRARARIVERYALPGMVNGYRAIYASVVGGR